MGSDIDSYIKLPRIYLLLSPCDLKNYEKSYAREIYELCGLEREQREREWREQEEARRRKAEKIQKEKERLERLLREAEAWQKAQQIRTYIEAVKQAAIQKYGFINTGSELDNWLKWATQQVDRLDPLAESPPSILDE